ncbi:MAG: ROK family protein [Chthoniobacterales bacterium]
MAANPKPAPNPSKSIILGIDIGGSGIKGAPVDIVKGEFAADRFRIPTPQPATPDAVAEVVGEIAEHFQYSGPTGITFPAIVQKGVVHSAANVDKSWIDTDARALFAPRVGGSAFVVNDADAAGVAEVRYGAGKDQPGVVILITLGTGIGTAVFIDGKLLPNTEFGHLKIRGKDAEHRASDKVRDEKNLSWKKWAHALNEFLAEIELLFSPDLLIIGGGVSKKSEKFFPHLKTKTDIPIVPAKMLNAAGIIGAAYLARDLAT